MESQQRVVGKGRVSFWDLSRYFVPLAIQSASQSFTYPLLASLASRGTGGLSNYAGLAQANGIMFILGTLGAGLVTTGMVFAVTREGFARFLRLNTLLLGIAITLQALMCIPALAHWVFHGLIGLPASIEHPAYLALLASIPLALLFFLRTPYQVVLYTHNQTALASGATLFRIVATLLLIPPFLSAHLVGVVWATMAQTITVAGEVLISWYFARRYIAELPKCAEQPVSVRQQAAFCLPLSAGGVFLSISGPVLAAMIMHTAQPERVLQSFYLASGLANPAAAAASRVQTVVLTYLHKVRRESSLIGFALCMGVLLGSMPLLFLLPGLRALYYQSLQNCPADLLPLVSISGIGLLFLPLSMALRAFVEGKAALYQQPLAILVGQVVFLAALSGTAVLCIVSHISGCLLAPISLLAADLCAAGIVWYLTRRRLAIQAGERMMAAAPVENC